jgi:hypothetical protein
MGILATGRTSPRSEMSEVGMQTMTPFNPATPEVVAFVEDRCDRIGNAAPGRGSQAAFIHAMKAFPWLPFRDDEESHMAVLALTAAARAADVRENIIKCWYTNAGATIMSARKDRARHGN